MVFQAQGTVEGRNRYVLKSIKNGDFLMGRVGRPVSLGFSTAEAIQFRRIFRQQSKLIGASNSETGDAIDRFQLGGKADGLTLLQNALSPKRKLTHRVARIIVAGLFLGKTIRDDKRSLRQQNALVALGGAMYAFKAWDPNPAIPAYIPPEVIDDLAARLAAGRRSLGKLLSKRLSEAAPAMARAWCERARRTPIKRKSAKIIETINVLEDMVRADYPAPARDEETLFSLGPEFDILHRERPELTKGFLSELNRAHSIDGRN